LTTDRPERPATTTSPWRWARVVYAVFALIVFCFPGGMVDWLDERNAAGWLNAPLAVARAIDKASAAAGTKAIGEALRQRFAAWVGESET
jgi:hypothetical protein